MTNTELRNAIADQIESMGYTGCANQIRANLKARDNALYALRGTKASPELIQTIQQAIPEQTPGQAKVYQLFDINMNNELFHMYAGYGFVGAKEVPVSKTNAEAKYNQLKKQLLTLVIPSDELDALLEEYESAAKEEYLLYAESHKLEKTAKSRAQYRELVLPLHEQLKALEILKVAAKIKLANYLMDNVKEESNS